jgi:hypothetical protein
MAQAMPDGIGGQNEAARARLHMMTTFLNLLQTQDFGRVLDQFAALSR